MIKISNIEIQRFRSIIYINIPINITKNYILICGQNNVGKTNVLRALNLFFNPNLYDPKVDIPNLKNATWGGAVHPRITLSFNEANDVYLISRDFKDYNDTTNALSGTKNRKSLSNQEVEKLLSRVHFFFIESANLVMPDIIEMISQDIITLEYDKARFSKNKMALKGAYDTYIDGLREILGAFADEISSTFKWFRESWKVELNVPKNSDTFRDLISDDVTLSINDKGSVGVVEKGSGLQRLAIIILFFEIALRISRQKSIIICIDEPDIFLHEGLQKKLKTFLDQQPDNIQIICTTHSKVFIDTFRMDNVFLLDATVSEQFVKRRNRLVNVVETLLVDINTESGYKLICEHLGIEEREFELLEKFNILVEGECDKKYLSELTKFFNIDQVNIISANGADNIIKFLDFYEGYYRINASFVPKIRIILDNDQKGRETIKKTQSKKGYTHIQIDSLLMSNCFDNANKNFDHNTTNNEIEDFVYPEVICYLVNTLLSKRGMQPINIKKVCGKIKKIAFSEYRNTQYY